MYALHGAHYALLTYLSYDPENDHQLTNELV
jgi:hypothetical protein